MSTKIEPQFNSMAELKRKCMEVEQNSIRIIAEIEKLQQENKRYREALEKLARLGNGNKYGNSDGNIIAQDALNSLTHNKAVETEPVLCPSTHGTDYTIPTPDSSLDELYEVILQWDCLRKSDLVVPKEDIKDLAKAVREHIKSKIDEVGWCGVGDLDNISREDVLKALGID